jgi:hypothetical protein
MGAAGMLSLALLAAWRWERSGLFFFALLVLRDLSAGWFLITRQTVFDRCPSRAQEILAYVSSAVPLLYLAPAGAKDWRLLAMGELLPILGYSVATFALLELGGSFGIAPARRSYVRTGVYRRLRHPMYTGYCVAEFGLVLLNARNAWLFLASTSLYRLRASQENCMLCPRIVG